MILPEDWKIDLLSDDKRVVITSARQSGKSMLTAQMLQAFVHQYSCLLCGKFGEAGYCGDHTEDEIEWHRTLKGNMQQDDFERGAFKGLKI